jgi:hypothetical protein
MMVKIKPRKCIKLHSLVYLVEQGPCSLFSQGEDSVTLLCPSLSHPFVYCTLRICKESLVWNLVYSFVWPTKLNMYIFVFHFGHYINLIPFQISLTLSLVAKPWLNGKHLKELSLCILCNAVICISNVFWHIADLKMISRMKLNNATQVNFGYHSKAHKHPEYNDLCYVFLSAKCNWRKNSIFPYSATVTAHIIHGILTK